MQSAKTQAPKAAAAITIRPASSLRALTAAQRELLGAGAAAVVETYLAACPVHRPTPLVTLTGLAAGLGLGAVYLKDESSRLGLTSFKALGGAYAVARIVQQRASDALGRYVAPGELRDEPVRAVAGQLTFTCASAGNHGCAVAAGARLFGARAVIFLPHTVSDARAAAIEALGAEIVIARGDYDLAIDQAKNAASRHGWRLVADTSWAGYVEIPGRVMQGYTVLMREAAAQTADAAGPPTHIVADTSWAGYVEIPGRVMQGYTVLMREAAAQTADAAGPPTHIVVQAGVGGLAAAAAAYFADTARSTAPTIVVVEPRAAASVLAGVTVGAVSTTLPTRASLMAMLDCRTASLAALDIIARRARAFVTLSEAEASDAVRVLAQVTRGAPATESAAAGLAGLLALMRTPSATRELALNEAARVLLFNTEAGPSGPPTSQHVEGDSK